MALQGPCSSPETTLLMMIFGEIERTCSRKSPQPIRGFQAGAFPSPEAAVTACIHARKICSNCIPIWHNALQDCLPSDWFNQMPIYHIRKPDGALFPDALGKPYRFTSLAEANKWKMPGERIEPCRCEVKAKA